MENDEKKEQKETRGQQEAHGAEKSGREDVQALYDAERAETEVVAEDGEEAVEERHGPADLRENEDDGLEDDEQPVEHCPESSRGLVGHGAASANERRSVSMGGARKRMGETHST